MIFPPPLLMMDMAEAHEPSTFGRCCDKFLGSAIFAALFMAGDVGRLYNICLCILCAYFPFTAGVKFVAVLVTPISTLTLLSTARGPHRRASLFLQRRNNAWESVPRSSPFHDVFRKLFSV